MSEYWETILGFEIRNSAQVLLDMRLRDMAISGALAGLAGAVGDLGVQFKFVTIFSAINDFFDGLIVAFAGYFSSFWCTAIFNPVVELRAGLIISLVFAASWLVR